jgi:hypothetical protein
MGLSRHPTAEGFVASGLARTEMLHNNVRTRTTTVGERMHTKAARGSRLALLALHAFGKTDPKPALGSEIRHYKCQADWCNLRIEKFRKAWLAGCGG